MTTAYDAPPEVPADMTPEQAQAEVNKMNAAFLADGEHPLFTTAHPQHGDYGEYAKKLHTIVAEAKAAKQEAADAEKVADLLSGNTPTQRALVDEARKEVDALVKLGFEATEVPADVQPHTVRAWRMQRLNAEANADALVPLMRQELQSLQASASTLDMFSQYVNGADLDPELRTEIFETLIAWIHQANTRRYGKASK